MSKGWERGSTRAWRKYRSQRLYDAGGICQLKLDGCEIYATQVHHLDGVKAGMIPADPTRGIASCEQCNRKAGEPGAGNPTPNPPATNWD